MAEISFGGLATGLPTEDLVTGLMAIERRPLERLEEQKSYETERLNAYAQFKGKLDGLRSAVSGLSLTSQVRTTATQVASGAPFSATSSAAAAGSYDLAVVQLAQVQKTVSGGFASDSLALLGSGSLTLGETVITIDETNNSLQGLAAAINATSDASGVQATIINDGSSTNGYHLVLTGKDAETAFTPVVDLTSGGEPVELGLTTVRHAQQAEAYVDGIRVVSNSNRLTGVIAGLTIDLTGTSTQTSAGTAEEGVPPHEWADPPQYQTSNLTVTADTEALRSKVQDFVDAYNGVMDWISAGYPEFGAASTASTTEEGEDAADSNSLSSLLRGDASINSVKRQLQGLLSTVVDSSGALSSLSQLGISTQRDGSLSLNATELEKQLSSNFTDVGKLLAGDDAGEGVMKKFNSALLQLTSTSSGLYAEKKTRYDAAVARLDKQILNTEALMDKKELALRERFNAMELLVSSMNTQSSFLTQQMDLLSNMMTGNN